MHLHGNHSDKLPTALPAETPGFWEMDVSVRFQILSQFSGTRVNSHRSKDHRQRRDPTVITAHPASSCSCRASAPASPNPRQSSIHSSESGLQATSVAICYGSFSPACSPLPGAWLIQQQNKPRRTQRLDSWRKEAHGKAAGSDFALSGIYIFVGG